MIKMAADRGAQTFKGLLLGFVLTDSESEVLISCYSQIAGNDPLSFRLEVSAFFAALCVIFLIL